jgi:hypothetical protein
MRPGPVALSLEDRPEPKRHNHGRMYRCKIVLPTGLTEYGEWFGTESDVRAAMANLVRSLGARYYCEMKMISCPECNADEGAKVISAL